MEAPSRDTIAKLLSEARDGSEEALRALAPLLHRELRALAVSHLRRERRGHTLQPTALVNEAWLRLFKHAGGGVPSYSTRLAFFAAASLAIRHVLTDHARRRGASKRRGTESLAATEFEPVATSGAVDLVALDDALDRLSALDRRQARIVELRFFGGLSVPETAHALECSAATVKRDWELARAWLYRELHDR